MAEFIYHKEQVVAIGEVVNIPDFDYRRAIKDGLLSNIVDIHRQTVDKAIDNPIKKNTVINPNDCGSIGGWSIEEDKE